jgi:hypothetical protein
MGKTKTTTKNGLYYAKSNNVKHNSTSVGGKQLRSIRVEGRAVKNLYSSIDLYNIIGASLPQFFPILKKSREWDVPYSKRSLELKSGNTKGNKKWAIHTLGVFVSNKVNAVEWYFSKSLLFWFLDRHNKSKEIKDLFLEAVRENEEAVLKETNRQPTLWDSAFFEDTVNNDTKSNIIKRTGCDSSIKKVDEIKVDDVSLVAPDDKLTVTVTLKLKVANYNKVANIVKLAKSETVEGLIDQIIEDRFTEMNEGV